MRSTPARQPTPSQDVAASPLQHTPASGSSARSTAPTPPVSASAPTAAAAAAPVSNNSEPATLLLDDLPSATLQRVACYLDVRSLGCLVRVSGRVVAALQAPPPTPFPALAALPSYAWTNLARSSTLRGHVHTLLLPRTPRSPTNSGGAACHLSPPPSLLDATDKAMLHTHFPFLQSVKAGAPASVVDMHFSANLRELDRMPALDATATPIVAPRAPRVKRSSPTAASMPSAADDTSASQATVAASSTAAAPVTATTAPDSEQAHLPHSHLRLDVGLANGSSKTASATTAETAAGAASSSFSPTSAAALLSPQSSPSVVFHTEAKGVDLAVTSPPESDATPNHSAATPTATVAATTPAAKSALADSAASAEAKLANADDAADANKCDAAAAGAAVHAEEDEDETSVLINASRSDHDGGEDDGIGSDMTIGTLRHRRQSSAEGEEEEEHEDGDYGFSQRLSTFAPQASVTASAMRKPRQRDSSGGNSASQPPLRVNFAGLGPPGSARGSASSNVRVSVSSAASSAFPYGPSTAANTPLLASTDAGGSNGIEGGHHSRGGSVSALALPAAGLVAPAPSPSSASTSTVTLQLPSHSLRPQESVEPSSSSSMLHSTTAAATDLLRSFAQSGGPLTLLLLGARNLRLPASTTSGGGSGGGLPNPYVSLTGVWEPRKKYRTSVAPQSGHPIFQQKFTLKVPPAPAAVLASKKAKKSEEAKENGTIDATAALLTAAASSSWSRGVRFRVYSKEGLFGKVLLGEVMMDLASLLDLAAQGRDAWLKLHPKESSKDTKKAPATATHSLTAQEDRGELHLLVSLDPTASFASTMFASAMRGLTTTTSTSGSFTSTAAMSNSVSSSSVFGGGGGPPNASPSPGNLRSSASSAIVQGSRTIDESTGLDSGSIRHGSTSQQPQGTKGLRRRSRSDAGAATAGRVASALLSPTSAHSAMLAPAATSSNNLNATDSAGQSDPLLSPAARGRGLTVPVSTMGSGNLAVSAFVGASSHRSPSPAIGNASFTRRAISMDLSSPQGLLGLHAQRRSLLAPVLGGDTPQDGRSTETTPLSAAPVGRMHLSDVVLAVTSASKDAVALRSNESSPFATPQRGGLNTSASDTLASGSPSVRSVAGKEHCSVSPLRVSLHAAVLRGHASRSPSGSPKAAPMLSLSAGMQQLSAPTSRTALTGSKRMTPRASSISEQEDEAKMGREEQGDPAPRTPPKRSFDGKPMIQQGSPMLLPPPAFALNNASVGAVPDARPSNGPTAGHGGNDTDEEEEDEEDGDDTILWSPDEQHRREKLLRRSVKEMRLRAERAEAELAAAKEAAAKKEQEHQSDMASVRATAVAASNAAAKAQAALTAAVNAPSAAVTRLETQVREQERRWLTQSGELKSTQEALASSRATHTREVELLKSKLMQSAAESAAFAAFKKSSLAFVASLRGANEALQAQVASLSERCEVLDNSLRAQGERHALTKQRYRARVTGLAEQLEQSNSSLQQLQARHDRLTEHSARLERDLAAAETLARDSAEELERQSAHFARLSADMRDFGARCSVQGGLHLLQSLREVAQAKEELAALKEQARAQQRIMDTMQQERDDAATLRLAHATLQRRSEEQQRRVDELRQANELLLAMLEAEVSSKNAAGGSGGLDAGVANGGSVSAPLTAVLSLTATAGATVAPTAFPSLHLVPSASAASPTLLPRRQLLEGVPTPAAWGASAATAASVATPASLFSLAPASSVGAAVLSSNAPSLLPLNQNWAQLSLSMPLAGAAVAASSATEPLPAPSPFLVLPVGAPSLSTRGAVTVTPAPAVVP